MRVDCGLFLYVYFWGLFCLLLCFILLSIFSLLSSIHLHWCMASPLLTLLCKNLLTSGLTAACPPVKVTPLAAQKHVNKIIFFICADSDLEQMFVHGSSTAVILWPAKMLTNPYLAPQKASWIFRLETGSFPLSLSDSPSAFRAQLKWTWLN